MAKFLKLEQSSYRERVVPMLFDLFSSTCAARDISRKKARLAFGLCFGS
jgi:hypothetical protein